MRSFRHAPRIAVFSLTFVVLLLLSSTTGAVAKLPVERERLDPPSGITVKGIGFGSTLVEATGRGVTDAEERAVAIAGALGLQLGPALAVELPEISQYGPGARRCPKSSRRDRGCRGPEVVVTSVTFGIVGGADPEDVVRVVSANGVAFEAVSPSNRSRSRSIKGALLSARQAATPRAATVALRNARAAAAAAGITLGSIVSVAEAPPPFYFGPFAYDDALGTFGPGRFCGIIRRPVFRRDPDTGERKLVRRVPRRRCFFTTRYGVHLQISYEAIATRS